MALDVDFVPRMEASHIVMYANIAAHRAVRSWFLRLIVNVVICAPWGCA